MAKTARPGRQPPPHPDRVRWNARYARRVPSFEPHELVKQALARMPPGGPVLELAAGPSGGVLAAAAAGHPVTAVDISDVALRQLEAEADRRGLRGAVTTIRADLDDTAAWDAPPAGQAGYALVLCTGYWTRQIFAPAAAAVAPGGLLAWEALTEGARRARPSLPPDWCLRPGEPATLLPPGFTVLDQADIGTDWRRLLARLG